MVCSLGPMPNGTYHPVSKGAPMPPYGGSYFAACIRNLVLAVMIIGEYWNED